MIKTQATDCARANMHLCSLRNDTVVLKGAGGKSYAKVLKADIPWEGNLVHVISSVLLPKGYNAYEVRCHVVVLVLCTALRIQVISRPAKDCHPLPGNSTSQAMLMDQKRNIWHVKLFLSDWRVQLGVLLSAWCCSHSSF